MSTYEGQVVTSGQAPACPLCRSPAVEIVDYFPFRDLRHLFFETCEVDIVECLDRPYGADRVDLYGCRKCGLEFCPETLRGGEKLYDALKKFDFYYLKDKWEFSVALLDVKPGDDLLEIGCGPGLFLEQVVSASPGTRVRGLELSLEAIRACRAKGFDIEAQTIEEFAREHASRFDVICAFQVLEHVSNPRSFLLSAFQCLRDGGLCVVTVPNRRGFPRHSVNDVGNLPPHHLTRWTPDVMRQVATECGVRLERLLEEPVAEYHKEWYRDTLTVRLVSRALGLRWRSIELRTSYRAMLSVCRRLQRLCPARLWRYRRYPGHTLYASFRKAGV